MVTPHARRDESGMTLIEVVVATAVLATLLAGVFGCMAHAMRADVLAREYAAASRAAYAVIDRLAAEDYDVATAEAANGFDVLYPTGQFDGAGVPIEIALSPARVNAGDPIGPHPNISGTPEDESQMAGRVTVTAGLNPVTGAADAANNLARIDVVICWRGADDRDQRLEATAWRGK